MKPIFLASRSKQRATLLSQLGLRFEILFPQRKEITMTSATDVKIIKTVKDNALQKARSVVPSVTTGIIISGDTLIVAKDQQIFGKPQTNEEALQMLRTLVGNWHRVISAVAVIDVATEKYSVNHIWTQVLFRNVSDDILCRYVATKEPLGKAGGYAIQGMGGFFIEQVQGSYTSVIGLPLELVVPLLRVQGINLWHYWSA